MKPEQLVDYAKKLDERELAMIELLRDCVQIIHDQLPAICSWQICERAAQLGIYPEMERDIDIEDDFMTGRP